MKHHYRTREELLQSMRPAPKDKAARVMLKFYTALDAIARGDHPGADEWRHLADAVSTIETMYVEMDIAMLQTDEVHAAHDAATDAMVAAGERFAAGKALRFDAAGLEAMRVIVDLYGQCLAVLTEKQMADAQLLTELRLRQIRAGLHTGRKVVMV